MAEARILYFGANGEFLMIDGSIERYPPDEFRSAEFWSYGGHSLFRAFAGNWTYRAGAIEISYRLVDDPFSEKPPVESRHTAKIVFGKRRANALTGIKNLSFERRKFRPSGRFDASAFERAYEQYRAAGLIKK
jgi:hypothetical protein